LGCAIAIDDFGVGFQSFERLKQLPVDQIKIDGTFVREMRSSPRDAALVAAAVTVARAFDATTVAEFVMNTETADLLSALGVDWGQGELYGLAGPIAEVLLPLAPGRRASHPAR
jgi:EAL domain-containing protein (putative c-di-GMP-specific phosphodiesterase class I)